MATDTDFGHDERFEMLCEAEEALDRDQVASFRARLILALALHVGSREDFASALRSAFPKP